MGTEIALFSIFLAFHFLALLASLAVFITLQFSLLSIRDKWLTVWTYRTKNEQLTRQQIQRLP